MLAASDRLRSILTKVADATEPPVVCERVRAPATVRRIPRIAPAPALPDTGVNHSGWVTMEME